MIWYKNITQLVRFVLGNQKYSFAKVEEMPDVVPSGVVYLVGDGGRPWCAALLCPCGCEQTIALSLVVRDRPRWRVTKHFDGTITLYPSIWRTKGCKSHFYIRRGRVLWVRLRPDPAASM